MIYLKTLGKVRRASKLEHVAYHYDDVRYEASQNRYVGEYLEANSQ